MKGTWSAPVLLAVLVGASITASACGKNNVRTSAEPPTGILLSADQIQRMKIATAVVELSDVDDAIQTTGKVAFVDQKVMHVFSPVSGRAIEVMAELGARVRRGDALAVIESPDIGVATSDVGKAQAALIAAERELRRQQELLAAHATTQRDLDEARDTEERSKAELDRAEQKATLFRKGSRPNQRYVLRSDLDGEVLMKALSPGTEIAGQYGGGSPFELFTIGQADEVWLFADVFELDLRRVKVGATMNVTIASWPDRRFDGKVDWISSALDPTTHVTRVRGTFANPDGALKPDMFASVRISADPRRALAVPRAAVLKLGDQTVVFVEREPQDDRRRFERLPVTVEPSDASAWLTVSHGLEVGDRIVVSGAILLSSMI